MGRSLLLAKKLQRCKLTEHQTTTLKAKAKMVGVARRLSKSKGSISPFSFSPVLTSDIFPPIDSSRIFIQPSNILKQTAIYLLFLLERVKLKSWAIFCTTSTYALGYI